MGERGEDGFSPVAITSPPASEPGAVEETGSVPSSGGEEGTRRGGSDGADGDDLGGPGAGVERVLLGIGVDEMAHGTGLISPWRGGRSRGVDSCDRHGATNGAWSRAIVVRQRE